MTKKYIIIAATGAVICIAVVLGAALIMRSMMEVWEAEQRPLPGLVRLSIHAAQFVQNYPAVVVLFLAGGSIGMAYLLSRARSRPA